MATVSGKIFQVKDGTTNLFPRTVIEAVYGLDKTIADVKTWVGNNYQTKYTFTISGTSGATYNLATIATQAANGNSAYSSLSNYLPLTGGTLSGDVTTNANIYLLGTNSFSAIVKKNVVTSGGWARSFLQISNNSDEAIWVLGGYGEAQGLTYMYFGSSAWNSDNNIRFYNSGTIRANTFQKVGGTSSQFLKADGSVDSNTYLTTSAAASTYLPLSGGQMTGPLAWKNATALPENTSAVYFLTIDAFTSGGTTKWASVATVKTSLGLGNYLPLAAQGSTVYRTTSGQIVDFNNSKGANEEAFFTISSNGTRRNAVGWNTTYGTYIYNYASAKYLGIKDDGTPYYHGNTLWHSGNANLSTVSWACSTLTASGNITTSGNIGIGTTSPSVKLQIASPDYSYMNTRLSGSAIYFDKLSTNATGFHNHLSFRRLDASLNVVEYIHLLGTYSSSSYICTYIAGTANNNSAIRINGYGTSATVSVGYTGGGSYKFNVNGVIYSTTGIFSDGYVSALGTASSSDAKLKDDITTISYDRAKAVLSALNPREWTWNVLTSKEGERGAGMVAQEVEPILPDTVKEIGGNLTLEYNTLFAYGLAMTKYLVPAVESLEERVARLERENEELKRQLTN